MIQKRECSQCRESVEYKEKHHLYHHFFDTRHTPHPTTPNGTIHRNSHPSPFPKPWVKPLYKYLSGNEWDIDLSVFYRFLSGVYKIESFSYVCMI